VYERDEHFQIKEQLKVTFFVLKQVKGKRKWTTRKGSCERSAIRLDK